MADRQAVSLIASSTLGSMPLFRSYTRNSNTGNNQSSNPAIILVQAMTGLAGTLKSILSILRNFIKTTNTRLRRQLYDEQERRREESVSKPGVAATDDKKESSVKSILKSFFTNPFVLAGIGALLVGLIPEDIRNNLLKYTQEFLRGFDVAEWAIQGLAEAINYVKLAFATYLGVKTAKMLIDLINMFLEFKVASGAADTVRGRGTTRAPRSRPGLRLGRGGAIGLGIGAAATALGVTQGPELLKEMNDIGTTAQNLFNDMNGTTGSATEKERQAINYFIENGYTRDQAAGIVGNLVQESSLDHTAVGDGGQAVGIAQWHPPRQADFKKAFGKDIKDSTFEEQLAFIDWELKNTEKKANMYLKAATSPEEAASVFSKYYERPGAPMLEKRIATANRLAAGAAPVQSAAGGLKGGDNNLGVSLSQTTVRNKDALTQGNNVNVAGAALPPKVVGQKENSPNIRPKIPSPVLGASELDESLFFNPVL